VIEKGWRVIGRGGTEFGIVDEVLGDADADIFNGLNVRSGMLSSPRYVPAERVVEIREGEIELDLDEL
jgi:hypothetical protein